MPRIVLVGCGKMGSALLRGWLAKGVAAEDVVVVDLQPLPDDLKVIPRVDDGTRVPTDFRPDVVVLAVKPQVMAAVIPAYSRFLPTAIFLSIAAGKSLGFYQKSLGPTAAVVRAMPNTPASIGRGVTVCCANERIKESHKALCTDLLQAVGSVDWITDEHLMDAVTAVSGSGPAYVFLLAEALAAAGVKAGLPPDMAARLALGTVSGSGAMLGDGAQTAEAAAQLRVNVTSPGGTTAAALAVLMEPHSGFTQLLERAVHAAAERGRQLNTQEG